MKDWKIIFKKSLPIIVGIVIFFIVASLYFKPAYSGYSVKQADVVNYRGMSNDIHAFREQNNGLEPLWTQSMFSGMPATQISVDKLGNVNREFRSILSLGLPHPVNVMFLYFIGFFIFALCLKINPWIAVIGALAFGFSSYFIVIIEAGHNTKSYAIAFMAPVVGAFLLAYRRNLLWGILLSMFFMMLEIGANHIQITYYLGFLLLGLGVLEFYRAIKNKTYKRFAIASCGIILAYGLAALSNAANLLPTQEYAKETIRGKNNLTITPNLRPNDGNVTSGLDKDYITQWSYGKSESLTLFIPYAKGGHSVPIENGEFADKLIDSDFSRSEKEYIGGMYQYWGDQPFTSGPVYVGALVFFLAILGLFFIQSSIKWPLLIVTLLTLFLSWGKNMMWFTEFFLENVPLYSKFRAVTIILVIVELCIPILAILFLQQLFDNKDSIVKQKKKFFAVSGGTALILLILIISPSITGLTSKSEIEKMNDPHTYIGAEVKQQISRIPKNDLVKYGVSNPNDPQEVRAFTNAVIEQQIEVFEKNTPSLIAFRASIFSSDAVRSLVFILLGFGILAIFLFTSSFHPNLLLLGMAVVIMIDLISLNLNYLHNKGEERGSEMVYEKWQKNEEKLYPLTPNIADIQIIESEMAGNPALKNEIDVVTSKADKFAREKDFSRTAKNNYIERERFRIYNENTHFRVADLTSSTSQSSRASYFHESIGGYHGAKLQRYQNLFEFDFIPYDMQILNMLNVKYIIQIVAERNGDEVIQKPQARINSGAMGNAWLSQGIEYADDENDEILKLGKTYSIQPENEWKLSVNDELYKQTKVYGREEVIAFKGKDSILVKWPDGLDVSMTVVLVSDINGKIDWVRSALLDADTTNSFSPIVRLVVENNFVPSKMTLVNSEYQDYVGKSEFSANGSIVLEERTLNYHKFSFESNDEQLAVFSEIFYPVGWRAKIDGKEVEHIRVNYVLRGLKVPSGKHTIEFEINDDTYQKGLTYATISSWLIFLLLIGGVTYEMVRIKKKVA